MGRREPSGFTLIELLVVVAIVAVLAAILFPVFAKARNAARLSGCCSNVQQITRAFMTYAGDWDGQMVPGGYYSTWGQRTGWTERILPYVKSISVYRCPQTKFLFSYGLNHEIVGVDSWGGVINQFNSLKGSITQVVNPAKCIMVYEWNPQPPRWIEFDITVAEADPTNDGQTDGDEHSPYPNDMHFPGPHDGAQPVGFVDGHVSVFRNWDWNKMTFNPAKRL